jgi:hypothetical protein
MREKYAFSERRACRVMGMAATTYRYRSQRTDEPLRTKLVELAREKPRFGYRRLHVLLGRSGEEGRGSWRRGRAGRTPNKSIIRQKELNKKIHQGYPTRKRLAPHPP